jgi:hypothetical protein
MSNDKCNKIVLSLKNLNENMIERPEDNCFDCDLIIPNELNNNKEFKLLFPHLFEKDVLSDKTKLYIATYFKILKNKLNKKKKILENIIKNNNNNEIKAPTITKIFIKKIKDYIFNNDKFTTGHTNLTRIALVLTEGEIEYNKRKKN